MKAISIWQPWASMLITGYKTCETRSWFPQNIKKGERIAIHAATKEFSQANIAELESDADFWKLLLDFQKLNGIPNLKGFPRGGFLGICEVAGFHRTDTYLRGLKDEEKVKREFHLGDWKQGRFAWELKPVQVFDTIVHYKGQQGLFDVDVALLSELLNDQKQRALPVTKYGYAIKGRA